MEITPQCVVALTWVLKDSLGDTLDELHEPVEFLVGSDDLLPAIGGALQGHEAGATLDLNLEPEDAFGDFDEQLVFLARREQLIARGELLDIDGLCRSPGVASWLLQPRTEAISSSSKAL